MRIFLPILLIAFGGGAFAQGAAAPAPSETPAAGAAPSAAPAPPATSGRSTTPGRQQPAKVAAPTKEQVLDQQAKKARDEQEKRMLERDRKMQRFMQSICRGC